MYLLTDNPLSRLVLDARCWLLACGVSILLGASSFAQEIVELPRPVNPLARQLSRVMRGASREVSVRKLPNRSQAAAVFTNRARDAEKFLRDRTSAENADAWLSYLQLDELLNAVQRDAAVPEQGKLALKLRERLVGIEPGLELSSLIALRGSVDYLIAALRFSDEEKAIEQVEKQLEAFDERIDAMDTVLSAEDIAAASAVLSILREAGQAPKAAAKLRNLFSQANSVFWVSESLVQQSVNRAVNETRPVNDCILGTRLIGIASLQGAVTADLRPSLGAALLNIQLDANFSSNNRGYNGPVQLTTTGSGHVTAMRSALLNENGISLQPAFIQASLDTQIQSIEHRLKLVRKIAGRQAAQQKPEADAIALDKLRTQVGTQFAEQTSQANAMQPSDPLAQLRPWIGRLDIAEPERQWGSSDTAMFITGRLWRGDQVASPIPAPPIQSHYDIAIQVHETLIDNALTPMLSGRTLTQSQLEPLMQLSGKQLTNAKPTVEKLPKPNTDALALEDEDEDEEDADEEPFEIDFARFRPIIFEAREGKLRVGVRGTRFAKGRRELARPLEITAVYEPVRDPSGRTILERRGDVEISFPGRGRLTVSQAAIKGTIQKSFADMFPAQLANRPLVVPQQVPLDTIRGRHLRPADISAENGWLTVTLY